MPSEWYTYDEYEENVLMYRDDIPVNSLNIKNQLKGRMLFSPKHAKDHVEETKKLLERAKYWSDITNKMRSLFI